MAKDPTLNFRPDQNTANVDKRKTARELHTHGSRRADAPHDKSSKSAKSKEDSA